MFLDLVLGGRTDERWRIEMEWTGGEFLQRLEEEDGTGTVSCGRGRVSEFFLVFSLMISVQISSLFIANWDRLPSAEAVRRFLHAGTHCNALNSLNQFLFPPPLLLQIPSSRCFQRPPGASRSGLKTPSCLPDLLRCNQVCGMKKN